MSSSWQEIPAGDRQRQSLAAGDHLDGLPASHVQAGMSQVWHCASTFKNLLWISSVLVLAHHHLNPRRLLAFAAPAGDAAGQETSALGWGYKEVSEVA